jgi:hypothetical protein
VKYTAVVNPAANIFVGQYFGGSKEESCWQAFRATNACLESTEIIPNNLESA